MLTRATRRISHPSVWVFAAIVLLVFWGLVVSGARSASPGLVAAVLPGSRSVQVGTPATAFVTVINAGSVTARGVRIALRTTLPAWFAFRTTDSATNAATGSPNTPVDILAGQAQTFVIAITPTAAFPPTVVELDVAGDNGLAVAPSVLGVSTLLLAASLSPLPDIVAVGATVSGDGIADLGLDGAVAMAAA